MNQEYQSNSLTWLGSGLRTTSGRGGDVLDLREHNLSVILAYLREHGPSPRSDIAQGCGLAKSSLTVQLTELLQLGYIRETVSDPTHVVGRPVKLVSLDGSHMVCAGVSVDVDEVSIRMSTLDGAPYYTSVHTADFRYQRTSEMIATVLSVITEAASKVDPSKVLAAIEIAVPGSVARDAGTVGWAFPIGWRDVPICGLVASALHALGRPLPVIGVDNNMNFSGLLAARNPALSMGNSSAAYLAAVRGVGGGILFGRNVFRGSHGGAAEFGHIPVERGGRICRCGRTGCLETRIGLESLILDSGLATSPDAAAERAFSDPAGVVSCLKEAAANGDPRVLESLREAGHFLGSAVDSTMSILNPDMILLDGYLSTLQEYLLPELTRRVEAVTHYLSFRSTKIIAIEPTEAAVALGALAGAIDQCLLHPLQMSERLGLRHKK